MNLINKMFNELPTTYWFLVIFRIGLVLIPQYGYIHPDEYFQTTEVLAGKIFEVEASIPWEFNSTFPVRGVTIPYFTIGMIYRIMFALNYFMRQYSNTPIITPYLLVVSSRLLMCLFSFFVDFSLYKICISNNEKYKNKLIVLASSYVMIVYATRTFSNTFELVLFALLLYYVSESLIFSNILIKKREYLNYRYETSKSTVDKAKFHKLRLFLTSDTLRNCIQISVITVLGVFNRPTFLGFALFPVFFWLYRGLGNKLIAPLNYHWRIFMFLLCCIPVLLFNVIADSFFYGYLTWGEIGVLDITINNFIFTPLNFFKYNLKTENLAKHGLHPRFLHALVNMPLLFNILAVIAAFKLGEMLILLLRRKHQLLPSVRSIRGLMILSYLAPLTLLSVFPHQEPRFLIPLIVPLVYLYGNLVLPETDNILIKLNKTSNDQKHLTKKSIQDSSDILFKLWLIINAILILFYGFIHQGGVYKVVDYLSKDMKLRPLSTEYHIISSHIYSMPESLLLQKSSDKLYFTNTTKYVLNKRVSLYEEGSLELDKVIEKIKLIFSRNEYIEKTLKPNKKYKVFLIITGSLDDKLTYYFKSGHSLKFVEVKTFFPHLSTEAFPNLTNDFFFLFQSFKAENFTDLMFYSFYKIASSLGLKLYEISSDV